MDQQVHKERLALLEELEQKQAENSEEIVYPKHVKLNFRQIESIKARGTSGFIRKNSVNKFKKKVTKTFNRNKSSNINDNQIQMSDSLKEDSSIARSPQFAEQVRGSTDTELANVQTENDLLSDMHTNRMLIQNQNQKYTGENVLNSMDGPLLKGERQQINQGIDAKGRQKRVPMISIQQPTSSLE